MRLRYLNMISCFRLLLYLLLYCFLNEFLYSHEGIFSLFRRAFFFTFLLLALLFQEFTEYRNLFSLELVLITAAIAIQVISHDLTDA